MEQGNIKQLIYRSLYRGCKETDILLGEFAQNNLYDMNTDELLCYKKFIEENEGDIYKWLVQSNHNKCPLEYKELVKKILGYYQKKINYCKP